MFRHTSGGFEFRRNDPNDVIVDNKQGRVTISYDLADSWSDPDYHHPFTMKFNLRSSESESYYWPIHASSEEVVFGNLNLKV